MEISRVEAGPSFDSCVAEIRRRGGETGIEEGTRSKSRVKPLREIQRKGELVLVGVSGWRQYSRAYGRRPAALAYLCGNDDNGIFAVRVASTCETIDQAIEWIEPAVVRRARNAGKWVGRQGDVYAIETEARLDGVNVKILPDNRRWDWETRTLIHTGPNAHAPLVPPPGVHVRFETQIAYEMGRTSSRGSYSSRHSSRMLEDKGEYGSKFK